MTLVLGVLNYFLMVECLSPMFSYYGGKQRLASRICALIPKHTVYVEPFSGSATIFFRKPFPKITSAQTYREVLNDIDNLIVNFYRVCQTRFSELEHILINTLYSREEYEKAKNIIKRKIDADDLWRAWAIFVAHNQGFAGTTTSWGYSVYGSTAMEWKSKLSSLNKYRDRFCGVYIECLDAIECIKRWDSPQTFFYCDPPYIKTEQQYHNKYTEEQFKELIYVLDNCQGSFILSTYQPEFQIPSNWECFKFKAYCSASGKGNIGKNRDKTRKATKEELGNRERIEYVYRRFNRVPVREDIQNLYESETFNCFCRKGEIKKELDFYIEEEKKESQQLAFDF